jgi:hypothetical protein
MCAMKEVTLFSDDPKSKESARQLGQVCPFSMFSSHDSIFLVDLLLLTFLMLFVHFSGNITSEPAATSKYCTILWN